MKERKSQCVEGAFLKAMKPFSAPVSETQEVQSQTNATEAALGSLSQPRLSIETTDESAVKGEREVTRGFRLWWVLWETHGN